MNAIVAKERKPDNKRKDADEFLFRYNNLKQCVMLYATYYNNYESVKKDMQRMNFTDTCAYEMQSFKDFVNSNDLNYLNVYSPADQTVVDKVNQNL